MYKESLLPKNKKWKLIWNDEFEGKKLDESKWSFRRHLFHKEYPPFTDEGVTVSDSCLHIALVRHGDDYCSAHLQTGENYIDRPVEGIWPIAPFTTPKFMHKYGYYECRCKLPMTNGWWAAFWLQSPTIGCSPDASRAGVELDIMESFCDYGVISRTTMSHNAHWGGYGRDHHEMGLTPYTLQPTDDDFHVYGLDWSRDGYRFYVDGVQTGFLPGPISDVEQFILISTECNGYRNDPPAPCKELTPDCLPDEFVVDYVRVYDEVE